MRVGFTTHPIPLETTTSNSLGGCSEVKCVFTGHYFDQLAKHQMISILYTCWAIRREYGDLDHYMQLCHMSMSSAVCILYSCEAQTCGCHFPFDKHLSADFGPKISDATAKHLLTREVSRRLWSHTPGLGGRGRGRGRGRREGSSLQERELH